MYINFNFNNLLIICQFLCAGAVSYELLITHSLTDLQEAQTLAKQIIDRGKELFSNKCYLDALWKYHNAYQLCCAKCVSSNIKGKALLGCATSSFELLKQYSSSHERNLFGKYTDSCLSECIDSALPLKFRSKVGMIYLLTFHLCSVYFDSRYYPPYRPAIQEPKFGNTVWTNQWTKSTVNLMTISSALNLLFLDNFI